MIYNNRYKRKEKIVMSVDFAIDMKNDRLVVLHKTDTDPDPKEYPPHSHFYWEILYFLSGDISYTSGGETVRLLPDTLILTPPHLLHSINIDGDAVYERYNILVKSTDLSERIQKHSRHVYTCSAEQIIKSTFKRFDTYAAIFSDGSAEFESISETVTEELIFLINHLTMPEISGYSNEEDIGKRIAVYIEAHLADIRSVDEIAASLFISRSALFSFFRNKYATSPHKYLVSRRLALALQKIKEGMSAAEAAKQSGFTDYPTFYRAFRAKYGQPPREWRTIIAPADAFV